jgi:hypothetical protein
MTDNSKQSAVLTSNQRLSDERLDLFCQFFEQKLPNEHPLYRENYAKADNDIAKLLRELQERRRADETTEPLGLWDHEPTPEMIMAGVHVWGRNERASTADDVRAIYIAMRRLEGRNAEEPEPERHPGANAFSDLGPKKRLVDYACGCSFWRDEGEPDGRCETHQRSAVNGDGK